MGCGDGKDDPPAPTRTVRPRLTIAWAARSRDIAAPASAKSAAITFTGVGGTGTTFTAERRADPAAYSEEYSAPNTITVQSNPSLQIVFYSDNPDASAVVAQANAAVPVDASGAVTSTITNVQKRIASVEVTANQSVNVGEQRFLGYNAKDANGGIVALSAGSAFFTAVAGGDKLRVTGEVGEGLAGGTASVIATVDDIASAVVNVAVLPAVKVALIANPRDPETTDLKTLLSQKGIAYDAYETLADPAALQEADVLMVMGSSPNYPASVTVADAPKVAAFVGTGRGVVLLEDAPAALSGYTPIGPGWSGYNISSIAGWFGNATRLGDYSDEILARDNTAFAFPAGIQAGATVYNKRFGEANYRALFSDSISAPRPQFQTILSSQDNHYTAATAYQNPEGGRVYWQFHGFGPDPAYTDGILTLLIAGTNWAARR
jgi:hypothetical protein